MIGVSGLRIGQIDRSLRSEPQAQQGGTKSNGNSSSTSEPQTQQDNRSITGSFTTHGPQTQQKDIIPPGKELPPGT